ncbi:MAG: hypothetical protein WAL29_05675, partial [Bacteroidales bacterium]
MDKDNKNGAIVQCRTGMGRGGDGERGGWGEGEMGEMGAKKLKIMWISICGNLRELCGNLRETKAQSSELRAQG